MYRRRCERAVWLVLLSVEQRRKSADPGLIGHQRRAYAHQLRHT
jgi:hypothetical protein